MDFDYFYGRGADQFAFYQIPKILITDEKFAGITMESKILYSLMLDRASLSAKNGWLDEDGKVFIYYKLDRIMADMHCANQKATKMLKELEDKAGLIERQKQGQGKPTKIYVKDFATGLHDYGPDRRIIQTHENHDSETNENHESRNVIITGPDSWKSCTNNTNYNNTDFNNTNLINLSVESASPKIKHGIEKDSTRYLKRYPNSGMLKCPYCGASLKRRKVYGGRIEWLCTTYINGGKESCQGIRIRDEELDGRVFTEPTVVEEVVIDGSKHYCYTCKADYDAGKRASENMQTSR